MSEFVQSTPLSTAGGPYASRLPPSAAQLDQRQAEIILSLKRENRSYKRKYDQQAV